MPSRPGSRYACNQWSSRLPKPKENKMNLKRTFAMAVALFLLIATIQPAIAQTSKGIIAGIVRDKTGAVIPGAKVTVTSQEMSETRTVIADERVAFRID